MKKCLIFFVLFCIGTCTSALWAQKKISGTVIDKNDREPLPGASVVVKGSTSKGTITDASGKFALDGVNNGAILQVSFIGYTKEEVKYTGQDNLQIELTGDTQALDEVVVTALGITKESRALGYAVSTIDATELVKTGTPNFATALYGKAPGMRIQSSTGGNTSAVSITVRGLSSLTGNTQPMLIVDGVPVRNGNANNGESWGGTGIQSNGIVDINPEDIETLSVLKGAAASALYGSEAANGVILVTSKKGRTEQGLGVEFKATLQGNFVAFMPKVQNEYGPGRPVLQRDNDYQRTHGGIDQMTFQGKDYEYPILRSSFSYGPKYDGRDILYWNGKVRKYESITDSPYTDMFRTGFNQTYNLSISKGGDKSTTRFSYTYVDDTPNQYNSTYNKHNFNLVGNFVLHPDLNVAYTGNLVRQNIKNRPRTIGGMIDNMSNQFHSFDDVLLIRDMMVTSLGYRNVTAGNQTLTPDEAFTYENPTAAKDYFWDIMGKEALENDTRLIASVAPSWKIIEGLTLRGRLATDITVESFENKDRTEIPLIYRVGQTNKTGRYAVRNNYYDIYYGDLMLLLDRNLTDKINLTANLGFQGRSERALDTGAETNQGLTVENWFHLNASADKANSTMNKREFLKTAVFGSLGVGYDRFLYLEGTVRQEKTSTLAPGHNSFFYPSVNASFIYTEAFKDEIPSWYDYGKVRVSYGVVGNAPDVYRANVAYQQTSANSIPYNTISGDIGNDGIRPETKYEWEFGLENKFLKNRIGLEVSYYTNTVKDQILPVPTTQSVGGTSILQNIGSLSNQGLEVALSLRPIETKDFSWDVIINYAFNKGKVISLADNSDVLEHGNNNSNMANSVAIQSRVGYQMGDILTYMPKTDEFGNPLINTSGDGAGLYIIDYGKENLKKIGNAIPTGVGGINTSFAYKGIFVDASLDFCIGGYVVSDGYQYTMARGINPNTLKYRDEDHGGIPYYFPNNDMNPEHATRAAGNVGPNGEIVYHNGMIIPGVKADADRNSTGIPNDIIVPSDKFYNYVYNVGNEEPTYFGNSVFENSYLKFRELSLGYRFSPSLSSKFGCKNLDLSLFGRNLFYFHKNKSGYDTETTSGTSWNNQIFLGVATTASTRSFGVSLRASF